MQTIDFNTKKPRGRPRKEVDDSKEMAALYAVCKGQETKKCFCCDIVLTYYSWSNHIKSKKHKLLSCYYEDLNKLKEQQKV